MQSKMRLDFYLEESGIRKSEFAKLVGVSKQNLHDWINRRDCWVYCDDDFTVHRVEDVNVKTLFERGK